LKPNGQPRQCERRFTFPVEFVNFWKWAQKPYKPKDHEPPLTEVETRPTLPWVMSEKRDGTGHKVTLSWLQAWLFGIFPDTAQAGWETFELSHRCGRPYDFCVETGCFVWESKSVNQSRAGRYRCREICTHSDCKKSLCKCHNWHKPPCK